MRRPVLLIALAVQLGCPRPATPPVVETPVEAAPAGLVFEEVAIPSTPAERQAIRATSHASWRGEGFDIDFQVLFRAGDVIGESLPFGQMVDVAGRPVVRDDGSPRLCNGLDGASLLQPPGQLFSVVHGECQPGVIQLSRLEQDTSTGRLTAISSAAVDLSSVRGGNIFCAAEVSPWGSHLAAEEYEADVRKLQPDGTVSDNHQDYNQMALYHRGDLSGVSPYEYGWMDEIVVAPDGGATVSKRYAMGRFSHELARVMPDRRTVYLSDDGRNGGFFVFVADRPDDLSSGSLYASRWEQQSEDGRFALSWIDLGHADEASVGAAIAEPVTFASVFEASKTTDDGCPADFARVRTTHDKGCLKPLPDQQTLASRLETRRLAGVLGATTELSKAEGMAFDAAGGRLYLAISKIERGMLAADPKWDHPGADHVRLPPNPCGVVFELQVAEQRVAARSGAAIDSPWIVTSAQVVLAGRPATYEGALAGNTCDVAVMANPDNLALIPEAGLLVVAEDSHMHDNNALWVYDIDTWQGTRLLTVPPDGEVAGINWFPDVGGWGYLTLSVQQPEAERGTRSEDPRSATGVLGPFPPLR